MRRTVALLGAALAIGGCGRPGDESSTNAAGKSAAAEAPKPAFCFFKEGETKGWKASVGKDGNVVVEGKVYREDSRYKALLNPATVSGTHAEVAPTITDNDTGYGAPDNWWDVKETIPNSGAVSAVTVRCGANTLAELSVPRKAEPEPR